MIGLRSINETNSYNFVDSFFNAKSFYRISLVDKSGRKTYSRIIQLQNSNEFSVFNATSIFQSAISLDVNVTRNSKIDLALLSTSGHLIKSMSFNAYNGTNNYVIPNLGSLKPGVYILQVRNKDKTVIVRTIRK
jgi:hypothetical protein